MTLMLSALLLVTAAFAQTPPPAPPRRALTDVTPVTREHEIRTAQGTLKYHSTTGMMPLRNEAGEIEANLFT